MDHCIQNWVGALDLHFFSRVSAWDCRGYPPSLPPCVCVCWLWVAILSHSLWASGGPGNRTPSGPRFVGCGTNPILSLSTAMHSEDVCLVIIVLLCVGVVILYGLVCLYFVKLTHSWAYCFRASGGYGKLAFFVCASLCFVVFEPDRILGKRPMLRPILPT